MFISDRKFWLSNQYSIRTINTRKISSKSKNAKIFFQLIGEWTQVQLIRLVNEPGIGLGFGIVGGTSTGVVVKTILPGSVADKVNFIYC